MSEQHEDDPAGGVVPPVVTIPADQRRYPSGCPDSDWCRGNRVCYWECDGSDYP